jgi:hypothetical protein
MRMTKGAGWAKQAGLSMEVGPLHLVVAERTGGVERARIRGGPRAGKERERKRKWESGLTRPRMGISAQKR